MQESKKAEQLEFGFPSLDKKISPEEETGSSTEGSSFLNWDKGKIMSDVDMRLYGDKFYELNSDWRRYNWDRLMAVSTLDHKTGYISEDIYGICTRTIKECDKQMERISKEMSDIWSTKNGE